MFNLIAGWHGDVEIVMHYSQYWSNNIFNWCNDRAFNSKVRAFYLPLTFKSMSILYLSLNCHISQYVVIIYNICILICFIFYFGLSTDDYHLQSRRLYSSLDKVRNKVFLRLNRCAIFVEYWWCFDYASNWFWCSIDLI